MFEKKQEVWFKIMMVAIAFQCSYSHLQTTYFLSKFGLCLPLLR